MHLTKGLFITCLLSASFLASGSFAKEPSAEKVSKAKWYSVETDNFTIVSDTSKKKTIRLAQNLEKFRAFSDLFNNRDDSFEARPVKIYVTNSDRNYKLLTSYSTGLKNSGGFFRDTLNGNYAVIKYYGAGSASILFHEYSHYLSANQFRRNLPLWYEEGLAEYLGKMEFRKDNIALYGLANPYHLSRILTRSRVNAEELFRMRVLDRKDRDRVAMFYSMSWLAVHYFKSESKLATQLSDYLVLTQQGLDEADALKQSMGMTFDELGKILRSHARKRGHKYVKITFKDALVESQLNIQRLGTAEVAYQLGDFFLQSANDNDRAENFFNEALKHNNQHARALAGKANIAMFGCAKDACEKAKSLIDQAKAIDEADTFVATISGHINTKMMYLDTPPLSKRELRKFAVRDYNKAINSGGINLEAIAAAGALYAREGQWDKVKELAEIVYFNAPSNHQARARMIYAYLNNNQPKEAEAIANIIRFNNHFSEKGLERFEAWYEESRGLSKAASE